MKWILLLIVLVIPIVSGNTANIDIELTRTDVSIINYEFELYLTEEYNSFEYVSITRPIGVIYDGDYVVLEGDYYTIRFYKELTEGLNVLEYTLIYDDLIEANGNKVFRTNFILEGVEETFVNLKLPTANYLYGTPNTMPAHSSLSTDGENIIIHWETTSQNELPIAVFYKEDKESLLWIIIFLVMVVLISLFAVYYYTNHKMRRIITDTLSKDELLLIEEVRKGVEKQKDVARNLGFSKSKMSKIVRKLEEKDLLVREPYFKTNKLKIKKIN